MCYNKETYASVPKLGPSQPIAGVLQNQQFKENPALTAHWTDTSDSPCGIESLLITKTNKVVSLKCISTSIHAAAWAQSKSFPEVFNQTEICLNYFSKHFFLECELNFFIAQMRSLEVSMSTRHWCLTYTKCTSNKQILLPSRRQCL